MKHDPKQSDLAVSGTDVTVEKRLAIFLDNVPLNKLARSYTLKFIIKSLKFILINYSLI
jgi:hypothetical protein